MSGDPKNMRKKSRMKLRIMKYPKMMKKVKFNYPINHHNKRLKKSNNKKRRKRQKIYKKKANLYTKRIKLKKRKDCT